MSSALGSATGGGGVEEEQVPLKQLTNDVTVSAAVELADTSFSTETLFTAPNVAVLDAVPVANKFVLSTPAPAVQNVPLGGGTVVPPGQ